MPDGETQSRSRRNRRKIRGCGKWKKEKGLDGERGAEERETEGVERGKETVGEGWGPSTPGERSHHSRPPPTLPPQPLTAAIPPGVPHTADPCTHRCLPSLQVASSTTTAPLPSVCSPSSPQYRFPSPIFHTPQRARRTYLGCSCSASPGAPPPRRPPASSLSLPRLSVPAALTYRARPGAAGPGGGYALPAGVWRPEEGKREKKREKVCHRLGGAGEGNAKPDRK